MSSLGVSATFSRQSEPGPQRRAQAVGASLRSRGAGSGEGYRPPHGARGPSAERNRRDAIDNGPAAAFTAFLIAADTSTVLETFEELLSATGVPANSGRQMLEKLRAIRGSGFCVKTMMLTWKSW